jgi:hypothetical protein
MRPGKRVLPGRHALFSGGDPGAAASVAPKKNGTARAPLAGMTRPPISARPARLQKSPVKSIKSAKPVPSVKAAKSVKTVKPVRAVKVAASAPDSRRSGPIGLSCSKCGTHSDVDILKYLLLHLPYWVWRPGRGYTSLMKCPACGKRAWVSASWGPGQD